MANRGDFPALSDHALGRDRSGRSSRRRWLAAVVLLATVAAAAAGYIIGHHARVPSSSRAGPHGAYLAALDRAIARLNARRAHANSELRGAPTRATQAKVERELASAHADAASAVANLNPGSAAAENAALKSALRRVSAAYGLLATVAARHDARLYDRARRSLGDALKALSHAFARIRSAAERAG